MPRPKKPKPKRRADGRFVIRYDGQWFYSTPWAPDASECFQQKEEYIRLKQAGQLLISQQTVRYYAASWLPIHKAGVKPATYNQYVSVLDRMLQIIGDKPVREVTPDDITAVYASLRDLSTSYITKARNLLRAVFDGAVAAGLANTNPCRSNTVSSPKGTRGSHRAITDAERELIHSTQHPFRPLVMLMLYSGVRPEEARGIQVPQDVDFKHKKLYIRRAVTWHRNRPVIHEGKNEYAVREVILLPVLEDVLRGIQGYVAAGKRNGSVMTQSAYDRAWDSYKVALEKNLNAFPAGKRWWGRTRQHKQMAAKAAALRALGRDEEAKAFDLPPWKSVTIRPYDLRHSFATMTRDAGVDIHVCMKWMGHSDEAMILRIYDHVSDYREKLSAEMLQKIGFGSQNGSQIDHEP